MTLPRTLAVLLLCACADQRTSTKTFALDLRVRTDTREAVEGASIAIDNAACGVTDAEGHLLAKVVGAEGQRVHVDVTCPANHRSRVGGTDVVLRRVRGLDNEQTGVLAVDTECIPMVRRGALVVRSQGAATLPILVNGKAVGQLDSQGLAHLPLALVPGTTLVVTLDTAALPNLRPVSPAQRFVIEDHDSVLVVDQRFAVAAPKRRRVRKPAAALPYRIQ